MIWIERLFWILGMSFLAYICFVGGYKRATDRWTEHYRKVLAKLYLLGIKL